MTQQVLDQLPQEVEVIRKQRQNSDTTWEFVKLDELAADSFQNGIYKPATAYGEGTAIIRINDFDNEGNFTNPKLQRLAVTKDEIERFRVQKNDILINRVNSLTHIGKSVLIRDLSEPTVYESNMMRLRLDSDRLLPHFFAYLLQTSNTRNYFRQVAKKAVAQASINQEDLKSLEILLPPLPQQRKIADILNTWDEAIDLTEQLIAAKQKRKQALMQQLLVVNKGNCMPTRRFHGFNCDWEQRRFSDVFERVTRKNSVGCETVLTISAQHGLISQTEFFNKKVASDSLTHYYLLKRGEFAYNKSYSEGYPYGAFKRLDNYDEGVISTLYVCFRLKSEHANADYFAHFFEAGGMNQGVYSIAQEGARNHGLLNMSIDDLFDLPIYIPNPSEQNILATFFNQVAQEIDLLQQKLAALRQQKKGLMQQLLTAKIRVKV